MARVRVFGDLTPCPFLTPTSPKGDTAGFQDSRKVSSDCYHDGSQQCHSGSATLEESDEKAGAEAHWQL